MDPDIRDIVEKIHASPPQAVIISTGGAAQALTWLMELPGSSRTVLEVKVPYGKKALEEQLGYAPEKFVTPEVAQQLAARAYERAQRLTSGKPLGVGCTASLATLHPKRGEHRVVIAVRSSEGFTTYDLILNKGKRDRANEDNVASRLLIQALAKAAGLAYALDLKLVEREKLQTEEKPCSSPLTLLLRGETQSLLVEPDGRWVIPSPRFTAVLSGAFNPWHEGHRRLARAAAKALKEEIAFELSVVNVDKPALEEAEIRRRLAQFAWQERVVLTRAATFREKAELFPGCTFVVGHDTAERIVTPRYYGSKKAMQEALRRVRRLGCRFLVAARLREGTLRSLNQLGIPGDFQDLFNPLADFRVDVSSSALRGQPARRPT